MNDDGKTAFRKSEPKHFPLSSRKGGRPAISNGGESAKASKVTYESLSEAAQSHFLKRELHEAMRLAGEAAKLKPTQTIFALLASICEGLGDFDKACDFRLLQAFLANDVALWEELLHEFIQQKLFYRASVCLRRLIALETKDKVRYRSLVLQLADLYNGLGETRRSVDLLYPLWRASRHRDFEVFAILSSVFFQLGRWNALDRLVMGSLAGVQPRGPNSSTAVVGEQPDEVDEQRQRRRRRDRRDIFFGQDDEDKSCEQITAAEEVATERETQPGDDDFTFDDTARPSGAAPDGHPSEQQRPASVSLVAEIASAGRLMSATDAGKKNFLTLVNVELELMIERGQFAQAINLTKECSSALEVSVLELPPELLLRCGVAYAHLGQDQAAQEIFAEILHSASLEEYGDAIFDAADCLVRLAKFDEAATILVTLQRFYKLRQEDLTREIGELEDAVKSPGEDAENRKVLALLRQQQSDFGTARCACLLALGKCQQHLGQISDAFLTFQEVLELDPKSVDAAVEYAELLHSIGSDSKAIAVLGGGGNDANLKRQMYDAVQRITLDVNLTLLLADLMTKATHEPTASSPNASGIAPFGSPSSESDQTAAMMSYAQQLLSVGIPLMESTIMRADEDGDTQSVATGTSSRRSAASRRFAPRMTRAASSIVPTSSIADAMGSASSIGRVSTAVSSIATTFRSSAGSARVVLSRHGAMTSSQVGRSAAHTVGGTKDTPVVKDASRVFRFNRNKKKNALQPKTPVPQLNLGNEKWESGSVGRVDDLDELEALQEEASSPLDQDAGAAGSEQKPKKKVRFEVSEGHNQIANDAAALSQEPGAIPDIEAVAASRFGSDPTMAALFIEATESISAACAGPADSDHPLLLMTTPVTDVIPTSQEVMQIVGKEKMVRVASTIIDAYIVLKLFAEAKQYALKVTQIVSRLLRHQKQLVTPLRLASLRLSFASGDLFNATRATTQLLRDATADPKEVWELLGLLVNSNDRSKILNRLLVDSGPSAETPLLCIVGNQFFRTGSYRHALNMYLIALQRHQEDPLLHFMVGLCYLFLTQQAGGDARDRVVHAGLFHLDEYRRISCALDPSLLGETLFNTARALQYLSLNYLAVPIYQRIAGIGGNAGLLEPSECSHEIRDAARVNLYWIYGRVSGNDALAKTVLPHKALPQHGGGE